MPLKELKWGVIVHNIFIVLSILVMADFAIPGRIYEEEILDLRKEHQQYYNAARNSHNAYKAVTSSHEFYISEDFVKKARGQESLEFSVSRIFAEVNWCRLTEESSKHYYSLRVATGLAVPGVLLILILLVRYRGIKLDIPLFIAQVLVIADVIYLLI